MALSLLALLGLEPTLISIAMVVLSAMVFSSMLFLVQAYIGASLQTSYVYRWQKLLFSGIFGSRWVFFLKHRHGDLINAVVTEAPRMGSAFYQVGLLLTGVVHGLIFLGVAAALSGLTTAAVIGAAAMLFLITRPLIRRAYLIGTGISRENADLQSMAGEFVSGAKLLKATATEGEAVRILAATADRLRSHVMANAFDMQIVKGVFCLLYTSRCV